MSISLKKLEDQTIVLTGATSGIGLTTARKAADKGVVTARAGTDGFAERFAEAVAHHRHFDRERTEQVPA